MALSAIPESLRWEEIRELGRGGQGRVYEVKNKEAPDGPHYALKVLDGRVTEQARERFRREVEAIKSLDHPSIIKIVDYSKPMNKFQFYVMELVKGARQLESIITLGRNPFVGNAVASVDLFIALAEGVLACESHELRIVHRDLSPKNILVLPDKSIKIIDFGICQMQDNVPITLVDEGLGTRNYAPPECESGSDTAIAVYSDLYSAGKVLWSAITGRRAFARERPVFTTMSMAKTFPNDPETWHLHHIFEHTVRRDPTNRWQSAKDAVREAKRVRLLIRAGYIPLEHLKDICPVCGWGNLNRFDQGHVVFGNPNPSGVESRKCEYCGYGFPVDVKRMKQQLNSRQNME
jgi:serine/threonine protein kinase